MTPLAARYSRQPGDPDQPVERVADAQRLELPGLLEQPLHGAAEAQHRDQQEEEPDDAEARARAGGRREDVPDRLGAASGQVVPVDDAVGRALAAELRGHRARDDHQRDRGRERGRGQCDRAVESRDLLEAVDDAEHELRPQPERQRADDALAVSPRSRIGAGHGQVLSAGAAGRARSARTPGRAAPFCAQAAGARSSVPSTRMPWRM